MNTSGEKPSEENVLDHGREELVARISEIRQRRTLARESFDQAGVEIEAIREEIAQADAESEGWEERFQSARDEYLVSKGRLQAHIEQLGRLAGE